MRQVLAFFGAFNPPTMAHVMMAQKALQETGKEGVVFVPSKMTYISGEQGKNYAFGDMQRLSMLTRIKATRPWIEVCDHELLADHQPRTYETLCYLRDEGYVPSLLCGADKLEEMETVWKYADRIAQEFGIVCMERSGQDVRKMIRESGFLRNLSEYITVVGSEQNYQDVSSSQVREILFRIAQLKHQLNELVPEEIIDLL